MKKILFILVLAISNVGIMFSQQIVATFNFDYSWIGFPPAPCYLEDHDVWKTSHGSPRYTNYPNPGLYNALLLETTQANNGASEGAFVPVNFSKDRKYRIEIEAKGLHLLVLATNGLNNKQDTSCKLGAFPVEPDSSEISRISFPSCPYDFCSIVIPSSTTSWNPDKDYSQFWISSWHNSHSASTSLFIQQIRIYDYGQVVPPNAPSNLRVASVSNSSITVQWAPATMGDYPISGYNISCNGNSYSTTGTQFVIPGLQSCTTYNIQVQTKDSRSNLSQRASVSAKTQATGQAVVTLNTPLNLNNQHHVVTAAETIILAPGFSVQVNNAQESFEAKIMGCD